MKGCELCPGTARMYCESDQASLCFDCDAKVHGANFLVARHSRSLLCRRCQAPTPWKATGPRLGPTVSVCDRCVAGGSATAVTSKKIGGGSGGGGGGEGESGVLERVEKEDNGDDDRDVDDDADGEEEDDDDEEDMEGGQESEEEDAEEEGEEQVVPWTAEPPPVASSSSSEEESMRRTENGLLKRMRGDNNADPTSPSCSQEDQLPCSPWSRHRPAHQNPVRTVEDDEGTSSSIRPWKDRRKANHVSSGSHQLSVNLVSFGSGRPPI